MSSREHDFSYYLDNYKDQFIAYGINKTNRNKALLENAKTQINTVLNDMTFEQKKLTAKNDKLQRKIKERNNFIEQAKKKNILLKEESNRLENSDLGAIEQNENFAHKYKTQRLKLILKVCLIALIIILLYIKDDLIQAIRSKFSAKAK